MIDVSLTLIGQIVKVILPKIHLHWLLRCTVVLKDHLLEDDDVNSYIIIIVAGVTWVCTGTG